MIKLKTYLREAKVSQQNLERAVGLFMRLLQKKVRTNFYRMAGPKGYVQVKDGTGIMYLYNKNKALRFNYIRGQIESITIWDSYMLGKAGSRTINLGGLSLAQAAKKTVEIISKNVRSGKFAVIPNPELREGVEELSEAKRVKPAEFAELVANNLPAGVMMSAMQWDDFAEIAIAHDKLVPGAVRKTKFGKGKNARYDLTQLMSGVEKAGSAGTEPTYSITVSNGDKITTPMSTIKGEQKAASALKTVNQAVTNPDVEKEMKNPDSLFGLMKNLVQLVCRKARNSLIIYGGAGTGKTFTVTQTMKSEGLTKGVDWFVIKGKITTASLYQTLFLHRKGSVLIFDDTDSVWGDAEAANILKAALDSYEERVISWYSTRTVNVSKMSEFDKELMNDELDDKIASDPNFKDKLPSEFIYEGRIIFISNLPKSKFDPAVLTRSSKFDMTLTDEQMFMRMRSVLEHLGDKDVPMNIKNEIVDFLEASNKSGALTGPSMRTYVAAEDLYKSGLPNWKELLAYV